MCAEGPIDQQVHIDINALTTQLSDEVVKSVQGFRIKLPRIGDLPLQDSFGKAHHVQMMQPHQVDTELGQSCRYLFGILLGRKIRAETQVDTKKSEFADRLRRGGHRQRRVSAQTCRQVCATNGSGWQPKAQHRPQGSTKGKSFVVLLVGERGSCLVAQTLTPTASIHPSQSRAFRIVVIFIDRAVF
jgi:hypothetical protein